MQIPSRISRWESIPTRHNPRFARNVHRAKRGPLKPLRRHSSLRSSITEASLLQLRNELNEQSDHQEGKLVVAAAGRRTTLLDGLVDNKIRFDRKGNPIIIVRRSTACSDITLDSEFFSDDDDEDEEDFDFDFDEDISEEASLVDDDDDDEDDDILDDEWEDATVRLSNTVSDQEQAEGIHVIPRVLILGLESRHSSLQKHPSRQVTEQVCKQLGSSGNGKRSDCVELDTAVVLTDAHINDSRDDEYVLAMASLKRQIQSSGAHLDAIIAITEDSDTSDVTLEGYHKDQTSANAIVFNLLESLQSHRIPVCAKPIYGVEVCRQWSDMVQKSRGLIQRPPIIFFHLPARAPQATSPHYQPYLTMNVSVKGVSRAISFLGSLLNTKNQKHQNN